MWAHIALDLNTGMMKINGAVDAFPAFEAYLIVNEQHGPIFLFQFDGKGSPLGLFGGPNRGFSTSVGVGSYVATE